MAVTVSMLGVLIPRRSSQQKLPSEGWVVVWILLLTVPLYGQAKLTGNVPKRLQQPSVANLKPLFCRATPVDDKFANNSSGYTAMVAGPDGKVYVGTANYLDYGYWLAYDPADRSLTPVLSIRETTGENHFDVHTQGKTHTKLIVGPDGKIYGGTKQGHELFTNRPEIGEHSGGYPGGHLLRYDPVTGVAESLGVLKAQDGLMNGVVDYGRRRIYFKTEPRTHFLIYEMDTNQVIDKGRVGTWARYIDIDGNGNVWIPNNGRMTAYDVGKDELVDYEVSVEGEGPEYARPYACVMGGSGQQQGTKLYGSDFIKVQEYDVGRAANGVVPMRHVCRAVPEPYEKSKDVHTMIRDVRGRIYWSAVVEGDGGPDQLLVMRYTPGEEESECLGYAVDVELEKHTDVKNHTASIQGSAISADGSFYLMATYRFYVLEFPQLAAD